MKNLEKLAVKQAVLTAEIREWKSKSGECLNACESGLDDGSFYKETGSQNHIQAVRKLLQSKEADYFSFEEALMNEFDCQHCIEWLRIQRKEILPRKLKLRSVRAAITRIGKKLNAA